MPTIKLILEYNGAAFHGWQDQPGMRTIQVELKRAIELVLRTPIACVHASGRTDAGVHARGQVAHFTVPTVPDLRHFTYAVSSVLKGDVSIVKAEQVSDEFHARFGAKSKQYSYRILYRPAPAVLDYGRVWHVWQKLDVERLKRDAAILVGTHDFTSLRAADCCAASAVRQIYESEFTQDGDYLIYRVVGAGFLKQMVRIIVGTLVDLGRGMGKRRTLEEIMAAKDRRVAGKTAPPQGLCLDWVRYE